MEVNKEYSARTCKPPPCMHELSIWKHIYEIRHVQFIVYVGVVWAAAYELWYILVQPCFGCFLSLMGE